MEHSQKPETTYYNVDGNAHLTSTVIVREMDDDEVQHHFVDDHVLAPGSTVSMQNVPTTIQYDISDTESDSAEDANHSNCNDAHVHEPMDDNWFPSLSNASWIQDLDKDGSGDDDTLMTDRAMETLFASVVVEIDDDGSNSVAAGHERPKKSRRTNHSPATLDSMDKDGMDDDDDGIVIKNSSYSSLKHSSGLVPLDIAYD